MNPPIEEDDGRVRGWLEPDGPAVERVVAGAFRRVRRRTALRRRLIAATAVATLLCAVAVGTYLSQEGRGDRSGSGGTTPAPVAGPDRVITAVSDGNVLVIHSTDGSSWVGNVERGGERPPVGSGTLIIEGGGQ